ncbi:hypothetical protein BBK82_35585 [Lentzea guizhouensis]|uniref:Carrier domain-containing protein n=1 Tax=Lentzea guizhouensis TaxID=1586287 RepID=A0A1B2HS59_9PSEU|nr:phosphopantetheine-binding protein [Lentzea guizhouensis]ANZ40541.1 hypothetical protein BBK82_35585 [Lentzea guizhouensis]
MGAQGSRTHGERRAGTARPDDSPVEHDSATWTNTERTLAEIWCEVLEIDQVGVLDNFFDVGGYSMLMHVVRDRISQRLNMRPHIVELFEHPTVRALGGFLDGAAAMRPADLPDGSERARARSRLARLRDQRNRGFDDDHDSVERG